LSTAYTIQRFKTRFVKVPAPKLNSAPVITSPSCVLQFCQHFFRASPIEQFVFIALDNARSVIGFQVVEGATNQCAIYPANIFRFLLGTCASAFIVAHNHPSGADYPSQPDWSVTRTLHTIGQLLSLPLLDHIIISGPSSYLSLKNDPQWPH